MTSPRPCSFLCLQGQGGGKPSLTLWWVGVNKHLCLVHKWRSLKRRGCWSALPTQALLSDSGRLTQSCWLPCGHTLDGSLVQKVLRHSGATRLPPRPSPSPSEHVPLGGGRRHFRGTWERIGLAGLAISGSPVGGFSLGGVLGGTNLIDTPVPTVGCAGTSGILPPFPLSSQVLQVHG